ncbi:unnamed protein product [Nesidiocoris tenuis]|uniref:Uncharacterized protein n=1 Tax=Nesidiocoris tenuis TaxID=355587 RepID=A0A6H5HJG2_9HEMI|nr:unnamed protein product [Nesidiocoris tenuis]
MFSLKTDDQCQQAPTSDGYVTPTSQKCLSVSPVMNNWRNAGLLEMWCEAFSGKCC